MIGSIETERLTLRPIGPIDVDLLVELDSDPEVMRYLTGMPSPTEVAEAELEASVGTRWLIFESPGAFVGWVGAVPDAGGQDYELGWRLRRSSWGKGLATEAALALVNMLFLSGATRVSAQTMAVNVRSRSVMERIGMRYVRAFHIEFDEPLPGAEFGEVEYELTREMWEA